MKLYKCTCGSEAIHIEKYEWLNRRDEISFAIWHYGSNSKWTLWEKLRHCWKILRTGKPFADQICLDPVDALELANDLETMAKECRTGKEEKMTERQIAEIIGFEHTAFDIGTLEVVTIRLDSGKVVEHHFNYFPFKGEIVPKGTRYGTSQQLKDVLGSELSEDIVGERIGVILTDALTTTSVAMFLPESEVTENEPGSTDS